MFTDWMLSFGSKQKKKNRAETVKSHVRMIYQLNIRHHYIKLYEKTLQQ